MPANKSETANLIYTEENSPVGKRPDLGDGT